MWRQRLRYGTLESVDLPLSVKRLTVQQTLQQFMRHRADSAIEKLPARGGGGEMSSARTGRQGHCC